MLKANLANTQERALATLRELGGRASVKAIADRMFNTATGHGVDAAGRHLKRAYKAGLVKYDFGTFEWVLDEPKRKAR
jgi:hypothetical protein